MKHLSTTQSQQNWSRGEKIIFRIVFIYFVLQALPLDPKYFRNVLDISWSDFNYADLFYLARYTPQIFESTVGSSWGLSSLKDWLVILGIALACAVIWSVFDKKRKQYRDLYYWLRVVLRYRLAFAVIAYGFIKVFPLQLPYPSLSLANTNYGDLSDWKIAHLAYGIAPSFEVFLGAVEILSGLLLLNRRSASIGAVITLGFIGNVFLSNLGYNGGETFYCLYLLLMAMVLIYYDVFRWHKIIMLGKPGSANLYRPSFTGWKSRGRLITKFGFVVLMLLLYSYYSYALFKNAGFQYPNAAGLSKAEGLYNVSEFTINNKPHPYSLTDSTRWQNVVFEKWPTISIRSYKPIKPDTVNKEEIFIKNEERNFESTGSTGRRFFAYTIDSVRQILYLQNKNRNASGEKMVLHYSRADSTRIILSGINEDRDSVYVVLDKLKKIYLLDESYKIPKKRSVLDK